MVNADALAASAAAASSEAGAPPNAKTLITPGTGGLFNGF